jgi:hypothetical protein
MAAILDGGRGVSDTGSPEPLVFILRLIQMYNFVFFSYFDIEWKVKNILILIRNLIEIKIHDTCTKIKINILT